MNNINLLAKEYKRTKSQIILNQIFKLLSSAIHKKATYVFYRQQFIKDKFEIEVFDKKTKNYKKEERVKCFRLCDTKKLELEDVEQELNLKVLELLENYDARKPFENYLFATLKSWRPIYIQDVNFIKGLDTKNESELPDKNDEQQTLDDIAIREPKEQNGEIELDQLFENLSIQERKMLNILKNNPKITQTELAKRFNVTQERISQLFINIRLKYKRIK